MIGGGYNLAKKTGELKKIEDDAKKKAVSSHTGLSSNNPLLKSMDKLVGGQKKGPPTEAEKTKGFRDAITPKTYKPDTRKLKDKFPTDEAQRTAFRDSAKKATGGAVDYKPKTVAQTRKGKPGTLEYVMGHLDKDPRLNLTPEDRELVRNVLQFRQVIPNGDGTVDKQNRISVFDRAGRGGKVLNEDIINVLADIKNGRRASLEIELAGHRRAREEGRDEFLRKSAGPTLEGGSHQTNRVDIDEKGQITAYDPYNETYGGQLLKNLEKNSERMANDPTYKKIADIANVMDQATPAGMLFRYNAEAMKLLAKPAAQALKPFRESLAKSGSQGLAALAPMLDEQAFKNLQKMKEDFVRQSPMMVMRAVPEAMIKGAQAVNPDPRISAEHRFWDGLETALNIVGSEFLMSAMSAGKGVALLHNLEEMKGSLDPDALAKIAHAEEVPDMFKQVAAPPVEQVEVPKVKAPEVVAPEKPKTPEVDPRQAFSDDLKRRGELEADEAVAKFKKQRGEKTSYGDSVFQTDELDRDARAGVWGPAVKEYQETVDRIEKVMPPDKVKAGRFAPGESPKAEVPGKPKPVEAEGVKFGPKTPDIKAQAKLTKADEEAIKNYRGPSGYVLGGPADRANRHLLNKGLVDESGNFTEKAKPFITASESPANPPVVKPKAEAPKVEAPKVEESPWVDSWEKERGLAGMDSLPPHQLTRDEFHSSKAVEKTPFSEKTTSLKAEKDNAWKLSSENPKNELLRGKAESATRVYDLKRNAEIDDWHYKTVKQALEEGKSVHPGALDDYPELKAKPDGPKVEEPPARKYKDPYTDKEEPEMAPSGKALDDPREGQAFYHGHRSEIGEMKEANLGADAWSKNLFGEGLYLTDDAEVAGKYAKKGTTRGFISKDAKLASMEEPPPDEILRQWEKRLGYDEGGLNWAKTQKLSLGETWKEVEIEAYHSGDWDHVSEVKGALSEAIRDAGFDGITHKANARGGWRHNGNGATNNVAILFDPEKHLKSAADDVPKVEKNLRSEKVTEAVEPDDPTIRDRRSESPKPEEKEYSGGEKGYMVEHGKVYQTVHGIDTTPVPKHRKNTTLQIREMDGWLLDNARRIAKELGDDHLTTMFEGMSPTGKQKFLTQADRDLLNDYLFDSENPAVGRTPAPGLKNLTENPVLDPAKVTDEKIASLSPGAQKIVKELTPNKVTDRDSFVAGMKRHFPLTDDEHAMIQATADARAKGWAADTGRTVDDWYREHFDSITTGGGVSKQSFQANRAAVEFLDDNRAILKSLTDPNVTSPFHELMHVMFRQIPEKHLAAIEKEFGLDPGDLVKRSNDVPEEKWKQIAAVDEKFARGFERYMYDGITPHGPLKQVFETVKRWFQDIYSSLKGSPIEAKISPQMREIFDRLTNEKGYWADYDVNKGVTPKPGGKGSSVLHDNKTWNLSTDEVKGWKSMVAEQGEAVKALKAEVAEIKNSTMRTIRETEINDLIADHKKIRTAWLEKTTDFERQVQAALDRTADPRSPGYRLDDGGEIETEAHFLMPDSDMEALKKIEANPKLVKEMSDEELQRLASSMERDAGGKVGGSRINNLLDDAQGTYNEMTDELESRAGSKQSSVPAENMPAGEKANLLEQNNPAKESEEEFTRVKNPAKESEEVKPEQVGLDDDEIKRRFDVLMKMSLGDEETIKAVRGLLTSSSANSYLKVTKAQRTKLEKLAEKLGVEKWEDVIATESAIPVYRLGEPPKFSPTYNDAKVMTKEVNGVTWWTDTHQAHSGKIPKGAVIKGEAQIERIIPEVSDYAPAKVIGYARRGEGAVLLEDAHGNRTLVNGRYLAMAQAQHGKDVQVMIRQGRNGSEKPILFMKDGERVGVLMPMRMEDAGRYITSNAPINPEAMVHVPKPAKITYVHGQEPKPAAPVEVPVEKPAAPVEVPVAKPSPAKAVEKPTYNSAESAMEDIRVLKEDEGEDTLAGVRIGDFYEFFGKDAEKVASDLEITLAGRTINGERQAMAGFPVHAKEKYLKKLTDKDHRIQLIDSPGDISLHNLYEPDRPVIDDGPGVKYEAISGNAKVLGGNLWRPKIDSSKKNWTPDELNQLEQQVEKAVLEGKTIVVDTRLPRDVYERVGVVSLRWGASRVILTDSGWTGRAIREAIENGDEPVRSWRLWRYKWDPKADVLANVAPKAPKGPGGIDREAMLQEIEAAVRESNKGDSQIVERREYKYTDGKYHSPFGVPRGVEKTDEFKTYWVKQRPDGVTVGNRFESKEAALAADAQRIDNSTSQTMDAFRRASDKDLIDKHEFWVKKPAAKAEAKVKAQRIPAIEGLAGVKARINAIRNDMTADEIRESFDDVLKNRDAIVANLSKLTIPQMKEMFYSYHAKTKADWVRVGYEEIRNAHNLVGELSYDMLEGPEKTLQRNISKMTQEDLDKLRVKWAADKAETEARRQVILAGIENPVTLEDFKHRIKRDGMDSLSVEQKRVYDELVTDARRAEDAKKAEAGTVVHEVTYKDAKEVGLEVVKHYHSKLEQDVHIVKMSDRVGENAYREMVVKAKKLGGWYSRPFKGSPAGFAFKTEEDAAKFVALQQGAVSTGEDLAEKAVVQAEKRSSKLREVADSIEERANASLGQDRRTGTRRQADMAAGAVAEAEKNLAMAKTMRNLADAIEAGEAKHLNNISAATHVEMLETRLRAARWERIRKEKLPESQKDQPLSVEDVDYVEYPDFYLWDSIARSVAKDLKEMRGNKRLAERVEATFARSENDFAKVGRELFDEIEAAYKKAKKKPQWQITEDLKTARRLDTMDIKNSNELRAAAREYLQFRKGAKAADPLKAMERDLIGAKIPGYFPTPKDVAQRVIDEAGISPGMIVLEPSAGKGSLAEMVRDAGGEVKTIEVNSRLRDILTAKGFEPIGWDFLEHRGEYDRIVMNPPFENSQDILHVRHAYDQVTPGGRVVAIMSEGPFFRSDSKASQFREWLEAVGGRSEKLPEGSFKSSDNPTGVNTRLVVIDKAEHAPQVPKTVTKDQLYQSMWDPEMQAKTLRWIESKDDADEALRFMVENGLDEAEAAALIRKTGREVSQRQLYQSDDPFDFKPTPEDIEEPPTSAYSVFDGVDIPDALKQPHSPEFFMEHKGAIQRVKEWFKAAPGGVDSAMSELGSPTDILRNIGPKGSAPNNAGRKIAADIEWINNMAAADTVVASEWVFGPLVEKYGRGWKNKKAVRAELEELAQAIQYGNMHTIKDETMLAVHKRWTSTNAGFLVAGKDRYVMVDSLVEDALKAPEFWSGQPVGWYGEDINGTKRTMWGKIKSFDDESVTLVADDGTVATRWRYDRISRPQAVAPENYYPRAIKKEIMDQIADRQGPYYDYFMNLVEDYILKGNPEMAARIQGGMESVASMAEQQLRTQRDKLVESLFSLQSIGEAVTAGPVRLERVRIPFMLPKEFYNWDFADVVESHVMNSVRRLRTAEKWGHDGTEYAQELVKLSTNTEHLKKYNMQVERALGRNEAMTKAARAWATIVSYEGAWTVWSKLMGLTSTLKQLNQVGSTIGVLGLGNTGKGALEMMEWARGNRAELVRIHQSGAIANEVLDMAAIRDYSEFARRLADIGVSVTGLKGLDAGLRYWGAVTGRIAVEDILAKVKVGADGVILDTPSYRALSDWFMYSDQDILEMATTRKLTPEQEVMAYHGGAKTQVRTRKSDMPAILSDHPLNRVVTRLQSFNYGQARIFNYAVHEARRGNVMPLLRMGAAYTAIGFGTNWLKDWFVDLWENAGTKKDRTVPPKVREMIAEAKKTEFTKEMIESAKLSILNSGMLGIIGRPFETAENLTKNNEEADSDDYIRALQKGINEAPMPPIMRDITNILGGGLYASQRGLGPLEAMDEFARNSIVPYGRTSKRGDPDEKWIKKIRADIRKAFEKQGFTKSDIDTWLEARYQVPAPRWSSPEYQSYLRSRKILVKEDGMTLGQAQDELGPMPDKFGRDKKKKPIPIFPTGTLKTDMFQK